MREDPVPDESVTLVLTVADGADLDRVATAVEATVTDRDDTDDTTAHVDPLAFDSLRVTVPQTAVDAVCRTDGLAAVETDGTLGIPADGAGEDVDPERD